MTETIKNQLIALWASQSPYAIQGQQLINLLTLFVLGKVILDLAVPLTTIAAIITIAIATEHTLLFARDGKLTFFSISSVLTALGIGFMLHASSIAVYAVVIIIAFAQKYAIRLAGCHVFNPSNLAITAALFLFPSMSATINGQWGQWLWLGILLSIMGFAILIRVGRWAMPLTFLSLYAVAQYAVIIRADQILTVDDLWQKLFAGALIIFTFFMLTDPRTTPRTLPMQALFITAIVTLATTWDYIHSMRSAHLFVALTVLSAAVPLMRIWEDKITGAAALKITGVSVTLIVVTSLIALQIVSSSSAYFLVE